MERGYIKLYRKTFDHWMWDDSPKSKFEAWILLLKMANHECKKVSLGNEIIEVKPGDIITSEVKLSAKLKWSRSKLRAYLKVLEGESMIEQKKDSKKTYLTICNYSKYCGVEKQKRQQKNSKRTAKEHNEELLRTIKKSLPLPQAEDGTPNPLEKYAPKLLHMVATFQEHVFNNQNLKAPGVTQDLLERCCDTIDKLSRLDGYKPDSQIRMTLRWALKDDFWPRQIISLSSIRTKGKNGLTKFDNLYNAYMAANRNG